MRGRTTFGTSSRDPAGSQQSPVTRIQNTDVFLFVSYLSRAGYLECSYHRYIVWQSYGATGVVTRGAVVILASYNNVPANQEVHQHELNLARARYVTNRLTLNCGVSILDFSSVSALRRSIVICLV